MTLHNPDVFYAAAGILVGLALAALIVWMLSLRGRMSKREVRKLAAQLDLPPRFVGMMAEKGRQAGRTKAQTRTAILQAVAKAKEAVEKLHGPVLSKDEADGRGRELLAAVREAAYAYKDRDLTPEVVAEIRAAVDAAARKVVPTATVDVDVDGDTLSLAINAAVAVRAPEAD